MSKRRKRGRCVFCRSLSTVSHDVDLGHACFSSLIAMIFLQACLDSFVACEKNAGAGYTAAPIRAANTSKTELQTVGEACRVLIALRKSC